MPTDRTRPRPGYRRDDVMMAYLARRKALKLANQLLVHGASWTNATKVLNAFEASEEYLSHKSMTLMLLDQVSSYWIYGSRPGLVETSSDKYAGVAVLWLAWLSRPTTVQHIRTITRVIIYHVIHRYLGIVYLEGLRSDGPSNSAETFPIHIQECRV